jgi:hypothetical protein
MAIVSDLTGLGMSPALAVKLGNNLATVNGAGTTQTGAAKFIGGVTLAVPTSSNTAFLCDSAAAQTRLCFFFNTSSTQTALIYPPSGGTINGGSTNAALSIPPLTGAVIEPVTGGGIPVQKWWAIVGANTADALPSLTVTGLSTLTGGALLGANSATVTPIEFQAGALNTTSVAGGLEYDGKAFYGDVAASQRGLIPTEAFIYVQAAITLLSQTAAQAAFIGTGGVLTNGEITLPVGTYEFVAEFNISGMSTTSGGFGFALGTANSAVIGAQSWSAYANKATLATPAAPQFSWNTTANIELATASTATVGFARIEGTFTVTTAGSIIPELSFTTITGAPTPIVGVGSYFKIWPLGTATVSSVGNWS